MEVVTSQKKKEKSSLVLKSLYIPIGDSTFDDLSVSRRFSKNVRSIGLGGKIKQNKTK